MSPNKRSLAQRARHERERNQQRALSNERALSNSASSDNTPMLSFRFGSISSQNLENFNYQVQNGFTDPTQRPSLPTTNENGKRTIPSQSFNPTNVSGFDVDSIPNQPLTSHMLLYSVGSSSSMRNRLEEFNLRVHQSAANTNQSLPTTSNQPMSASAISSTSPVSDIVTHKRHYLGKMDVLCMNCAALHWDAERLSNSSRRLPLFGMCCLQGKIKLPLLSALPPALQALFDGDNRLSKSYREKMRQYNAI